MPGACSLASHIALVWAGAPYKVAVLSHAEVGGDDYRRINPKGAVPALVLDDGAVITESWSTSPTATRTATWARRRAACWNARS